MRVGVLCEGGGAVWRWGCCVQVGMLCEDGGGGAVWGWGCYVGVEVLCEGGGAV